MNDLKEFGFMALIGVIAFAILFFIVLIFAYPLMESSCKARWEGNTNISSVDYSLMGGCRVHLKDGQILPEKNYRVMGDEE